MERVGEVCHNSERMGKRKASSLVLTARMTQGKVIALVQQRGKEELPGTTGGV